MKLDGFDQEWLTTCTLRIPGQASSRQDEAHDVVAVCEKSTIFGRATVLKMYSSLTSIATTIDRPCYYKPTVLG